MFQKVKWYLILHILFLVYAFCAPLGKAAGMYPFGSLRFLIFYGSALACMAFYALIWQQVMKHIALTSAYANRAVTVLWGMIFGRVIYDETITWRQLFSAVLIGAGIVLFTFSGSDD